MLALKPKPEIFVVTYNIPISQCALCQIYAESRFNNTQFAPNQLWIASGIELVSEELNHIVLIASLFQQIRAHTILGDLCYALFEYFFVKL